MLRKESMPRKGRLCYWIAPTLIMDDVTRIVYVELELKEIKKRPCLDTLGLFSRIKAPRMSPSQDTKQNKSCCSSSLSSQIPFKSDKEH